MAHGVLLVIGQHDHIFSLVAEKLVEVVGHVLCVVDASSELTFLAEVVDANQEGLSPACAVRVLESIAVWGAMTECLGLLWGSDRSSLSIATVVVDVLSRGICCGHVKKEMSLQDRGRAYLYWGEAEPAVEVLVGSRRIEVVVVVDRNRTVEVVAMEHNLAVGCNRVVRG